MKNKEKIGIAIFAVIIGIFIIPWIYFWLCYFWGWIAKLLIGKYLIEGFGLLGLTIPLDKIPLLAGCFGWLGGFFKNSSVKYNNEN